jgi:DNA ligase-associated metallophosphoesterase
LSVELQVPLAFARSPCGSLRLGVADAPVTLRASGALWMEAEGALVAADLHLEKGSAYAARGQMLPPYDTRETLRRLAAEVEALDPRTLIFLGDTFHDGEAEDRLADEDADRLRALAQGRRMVWVVGNHDADGPSPRLPGESLEALALGGLTFRHEPRAGRQPGEAAGHLHPAARVRSALGSVRRRCFVTDGERIVLPAFGAYAGGLNVLDEAFAGLFARPPILGALGPAQVHAVGWRSLRPD